MASESEVKAVKAKLYNLKSGIEGMIALLDSGVMEPSQAIDGCAALSAKAVDEWTKSSA